MTANDAATSGDRAARLLMTVATKIPGTRLGPGLTRAETDAIEQRFGFEFAADHRAFLRTVLPVGPQWPEWRSGDDTRLRKRLSWPVDGVLFDVEHNDVWLDMWGARPGSGDEAVAVAREQLASVPQLVPIYGHRYLPSGRAYVGHPVLSVYQTDIIYYGMNLLDYVHQEFGAGPGIERQDPRWLPRATVPFWRALVG
jgi:hypothetical protein